MTIVQSNRSKLEQAINALAGHTQEEIVHLMKAREIKNLRGTGERSCHCPVAQLLAAMTGLKVNVISVCAWTGPERSVDLPEVLRELVWLFDRESDTPEQTLPVVYVERFKDE